jgi:hypothetical protein
MKSMTKKPVWAVWGNGYGIYYEPVQAFWRDDLKEWWSSDSNHSVKKLGYDMEDGLTFTFASYNIIEVKLFLKGFTACANILKNILRNF